MIHLVYCAKPRFGGWVSFTEHLARSLEAQGVEAALFRVTKTTEKGTRPFSGKVVYQNVAPAAAREIFAKEPAIVTAVGPGEASALREWLRPHHVLVVHDPTELKDGALLDLVRVSKVRVVVIRPANVDKVPGSTYIPHPYVRVGGHNLKMWNAVSLSRLDWDKHTDVIVAANRSLPKDKRVRIYGSANRMYTHHKLDGAFPGWQEDYAGEFPRAPGAAVDLAKKAHYVVDMSAIAGDGGGTQYTFLEAWDAGATLVVNKKWVLPGGVIQDGKTAFAVESPGELAAVLHGTRGVLPKVSLSKHAPSAVVPSYLKLLGVKG